MWVTEMGSYPSDGKKSPSGRVRYLEDLDGDGAYEKSTLFLDGLAYPTGTLPWREGVLVTCAPDIFYAADTDGDGKADKRELLFTGFTEGNPQHLVNGLSWGLDNWVYGANGDSGGNVKSTKTGKSVSISGRDFRFKPDTGEFETVTGMSQFGRTRNDAGDWFGCNNVNPAWHFALDAAYLKRNPHVVPPAGRVDVPKIPGSSPVYPISRTLPRFNDYHTADHFTSACSVHVYRDGLMPPPVAVAGSSWVYVCEPVHNLVSRQVMRADGTTFTSERAASEQKSEFLASSDNYFRPATVTTGPDGAIYIADMYRLVIEHPEWIPKEWQEKLNLRSGEDKGRIYRVSPIHEKRRAVPRLDKLTTEQLVAALNSPGGWQRDMAHMMLLWRGDNAAAPLLEKLVRDPGNSAARLHALCALEGLGKLSPETLAVALRDLDSAVKRHAVRLIPGRDAAVDEERAVSLAADRDPQVRLQWAYSLGQIKAPWAARQLARLATDEGADRFLLAAVVSSLHAGNVGEFTKAVLEQARAEPLSATLLSGIIRTATGTGKTEALSPVLAAITRSPDGRYQAWQFQTVAALLDALEQSKISLEKLERDGLANAAKDVAAVLAAARTVVRDESAVLSARTAAMALLLRGDAAREQDLSLIRTALAPQSKREVQAAAISRLAARRDPQTPALLIGGLKSFTLEIRASAMDVLLSRGEWASALLDAIERKEITSADLGPGNQQRLLQSSSDKIRERATSLLAQMINPDRQKVVDSYAHATQLKGDPDRGKEVFTRACATCHRAGSEGHSVGPDLAAVGDKSPVGLLVAILDPNRAIEPRYLNYIAETNDGDTHTGILVSELDNVVKLLGPGGESISVLRRNLRELRTSKTSLMPQGLEASVSVQAMADLIAFIQAVR
jgi:putative membrane-bound dehydrogenase-like protein